MTNAEALAFGTSGLLKEREATHGRFAETARVAQRIKSTLHPEGRCFSDTQAEALDMIASKLARIVAGDANFADHWTDVSGYAELVAAELRQKDSEQ